MGEAKRRQQLLGNTYGLQIPLEKCHVPSKITFGYVSDEALKIKETQLYQMPDNFKSVFFNALFKAQSTEQAGIVFSEALKFSGEVAIEVTLRDDIETFIKSRCNNLYLALRLIQKVKSVDYNTHRVVALLGESNTPTLALNVYSLQQIDTLLQFLKHYKDVDAKYE